MKLIHFMKKIILLFIFTLYDAQALEVNVGTGTFDWNVEIPRIYTSYKTLDIYTLDISEQHYNLDNSRFYLFGNINFYKSTIQTQKEQPTANQTIFDLIGIKIDLLATLNDIFDNALPISSKYKVNGVDGDIGVGYEIISNDKGYIGAGVTFGMAFPFLKDTSTVQLFSKGTNTEVSTYKFGLSLQSRYNLTQNFSFYSTIISAYQIGNSTNPSFKSSLDMKGIYYFINGGLEISPDENSEFSNFYMHLGFIAKNWDVTEISFSIAGIKANDISSLLKNNLFSNYVYWGLGYHF